MNKHALPLLGLHVQLRLARLGWINGAALLLFAAGVAAWAWSVPQLRAGVDLVQQDLGRVGQARQPTDEAAVALQHSTAGKRLTLFYGALGERHYAEQQIKTLFAIAAKNNLILSQAEYESTFNQNGRYHTYKIQLPVKGSYRAIRQFCEQSLLAIPFASLDEINFRRESIASPILEAKLRFSLYLNDAPVQDKSPIAAGRKGAF